MKVAVLGATGFIGRALVPALAEHAEVLAISRRGDARQSTHVQAVAADATDEAAIGRALEGVDVAYYLVHSLGTSDFGGVDLRAAAAVATAADRAGVSQIVYLGGLGDDADDLSSHLRSRAETAAVLSRGGAVPVTILRAAVVVGRGSAGFETIVALVDRLPLMIAPRWVATPTQPIALADVVGYLAGVAGNPRTSGQTRKEPVADCRPTRGTEREPERADALAGVEKRELGGLCALPPCRSALDDVARGDAAIVEPTTDLRIVERCFDRRDVVRA